MNLSGLSVFISGGSGSFGSAFIKNLIDTNNIPNYLTVYSRDWQKQKTLRDSLNNPSWISWVLGDIRDRDRLREAISEHNIVIHAGAIKCIEACENNPTECLNTNVVGTQNILDTMDSDATAILISTDKAVHPINTYGTSKKMAEKLWIRQGGNVCRYGNVIGSSGSVLPVFLKMIYSGAKSLPVTHEGMTRYWYPMQDAVNFVMDSIGKTCHGEVFIPKIPSIRIIDLCEALGKPYHVVGIREGEKLHECMIAPDDITGDKGYTSGNNPHFLTVEEIRKSMEGLI